MQFVHGYTGGNVASDLGECGGAVAWRRALQLLHKLGHHINLATFGRGIIPTQNPDIPNMHTTRVQVRVKMIRSTCALARTICM